MSEKDVTYSSRALSGEQVAQIVEAYRRADERDEMMVDGEYNASYQWYEGFCEALVFVLDMLGVDPDV